MVKVLKVDLKRILTHPSFYSSMCIALFLILQEGFAAGLVDHYGEGAKATVAAVDLYGMTIFFSSLVLLLPFLCTLPYSASFCDDWNSRFIRPLIQRSGCRTYIKSKIIVTALSGFVSIFVPLIIYGLLCLMRGLPYDPASGSLESSIWQPFTRIGGGSGYIAMQSLFLGFSGAMWAVIALAISTFCPNKYITYTMPFVWCYALNFLAPRFGLGWLSPYACYDPGNLFSNTNIAAGFLYMILYHVIFITLGCICFHIGVRRRLCND